MNLKSRVSSIEQLTNGPLSRVEEMTDRELTHVAFGDPQYLPTDDELHALANGTTDEEPE